LNFLFRYHAQTGNDEALEMALKTLRAMAEGGMNDQLGGGFHRYSVDEMWFLPHFEKMLYDQAQLAISYLEAFQITHDPYFAQIARTVLDYVLRDMTAPEGGFYSAEDADSVIDAHHPKEKGEGAFYVWTRQELDTILGHPAASLFSSRYGVETGGNVHQDPHEEFVGKNILYIKRSLEETARQFGMTVEEVQASLDESKKKLLEHREHRVRPHLDDKILTAWNGLMISAFAKGAQVLEEPRYASAARRAVDFILTRMYDPAAHTLLRRYRDGDAAIPGFLDDYAFFIQALLDLYETEFRVSDLQVAIESLTGKMLESFEDSRQGGFFATPAGDASLVMRMKDDYDGAEPAGNSIALLDLLRIAQISNRAEHRQAAERAMAGLGSRMTRQGAAVPQMLVAFQYSLAPKQEVILAGDPTGEATKAFLRTLRSRFLPDTIVLLVDSDQTFTELSRLNPAIPAAQRLDSKPTAYVCRNFTCRLPTNDREKFEELLQ
jgi:uncharacterized protein YyaL (SSP411 family)